MNDLALARTLHVLGVVLWIGGVAFVTLVLLPGLRGLRESRGGEEVPDVFEALERRFATQARYTTQLTGLTGLYMAWRLDLWSRFADPAYWWMDAMVLLYLVFTVMLFVLEPFVLHRRFEARAARDPVGTRRAILRMHRVLLAASLITIAGAVAGSHGWLIGHA
ncbi:MAG: hypothetical protein ABI330_13105 [Caldimonas sp.]